MEGSKKALILGFLTAAVQIFLFRTLFLISHIDIFTITLFFSSWFTGAIFSALFYKRPLFLEAVSFPSAYLTVLALLTFYLRFSEGHPAVHFLFTGFSGALFFIYFYSFLENKGMINDYYRLENLGFAAGSIACYLLFIIGLNSYFVYALFFAAAVLFLKRKPLEYLACAVLIAMCFFNLKGFYLKNYRGYDLSIRESPSGQYISFRKDGRHVLARNMRSFRVMENRSDQTAEMLIPLSFPVNKPRSLLSSEELTEWQRELLGKEGVRTFEARSEFFKRPLHGIKRNFARFIRKTDKSFDSVYLGGLDLLNTSDLSKVSTGSFRALDRITGDGGTVFFYIYGEENYIGRELGNILLHIAGNACSYFPYRHFEPGPSMLCILSKRPIPVTKEALSAHMQGRFSSIRPEEALMLNGFGIGEAIRENAAGQGRPFLFSALSYYKGFGRREVAAVLAFCVLGFVLFMFFFFKKRFTLSFAGMENIALKMFVLIYIESFFGESYLLEPVIAGLVIGGLFAGNLLFEKRRDFFPGFSALKLLLFAIFAVYILMSVQSVLFILLLLSALAFLGGGEFADNTALASDRAALGLDYAGALAGTVCSGLLLLPFAGYFYSIIIFFAVRAGITLLKKHAAIR